MKLLKWIALGLALALPAQAGTPLPKLDAWPSAAPLTLPVAPLALCSSVRYASWNGKWGRIQRTSDSTQIDIGFRNNLVDWQTAVNWAQGSALTVAKCYDQSGNGNDFTQATTANQPDFSPLNLYSGIAPIVIDGYFDNYNSTNPKSLLIPSTISVSSQGFSVMMAMRQVISYEYQNFFEFTSGATTNFSEFLFTASPGNPGTATNNSGAFNISSIRPRAGMTMVGVTSGASAQNIIANSATSAQTAAASVTMNGGGQIGASITGTPAGQFNGQFDLFAIAIFNSQISAGNVTAVQQAYGNAFPMACASACTTRVIYGGSSLITGLGSSYNQNVIRLENLPGNVEVYNMAIAGQTVAAECSGTVNTDELGMYDGTKTSNIFVIDAPSNDIANQGSFANSGAAITFADNLYNNTTVPCVAARIAAGGTAHVVVPTIISRTGFDTTSNFLETARAEYNSKVVAGAVTNGYTTADRAGSSLIGCQTCNTNLTYFYPDNIHLNNAGYAVMAPIDAGAIGPSVH